MRQSYIPRPKPTWLDWLTVVGTIVLVVWLIVAMTYLGDA